jgi:hypothetical protein
MNEPLFSSPISVHLADMPFMCVGHFDVAAVHSPMAIRWS